MAKYSVDQNVKHNESIQNGWLELGLTYIALWLSEFMQHCVMLFVTSD